MSKVPLIVLYLLAFFVTAAQASITVTARWSPPAQPADDEIPVKEYALYLSSSSGTQKVVTSALEYQFISIEPGDYSLQVSAISADLLEGQRTRAVRFRVESDGSLDSGGGSGLPKLYLFGEMDSRLLVQNAKSFSLVEIPSEGTPIVNPLGRFSSIVPAIPGADLSQRFVGLRATTVKRKAGFEFATLSDAGEVLASTKMVRVGKGLNGCAVNQQPLGAQLKSQGNLSQVVFLLRGKPKLIPLGSDVRRVECLNRSSGLPHFLVLRSSNKGLSLEVVNERGRRIGLPLALPKRASVHGVFVREYTLPLTPMIAAVIVAGGKTQLVFKPLSEKGKRSLVLDGVDAPIDRMLLRERDAERDLLQLHLRNGQLASPDLQFNGGEFVQSGDSSFPLAGKLAPGHVVQAE